ncbi:hypothetical protein CCZ01_03160 [Helicobacter monodelphidis]|uniref:class D beta-lactamase n=1 Tax=Helicobacter sp. 15-1451 TaxID=2004995 RepID=UPI000DCBCF1C|nr:class D beta-lactamase [Helicobacter sp. 15-1451]RAX58429.1 hypothetical protein CCZ01_03160 [Helicobacter sp. 15-1451]
MILKIIFIIILSNTFFAFSQQQQDFNIINQKLESIFKKYGVKGVLVIQAGFCNQEEIEKCPKYSTIYKQNIKNNSNDFNRSKIRYMPASTFKIYHSLFALDSGIIPNVDKNFYHYSGESVAIESWKSDANLRNAMHKSQVPAFQQIAQKLGKVRMQNYLTTLHFGNETIGEKLDYFWLDNSLKISAQEQISLIGRLSTLSLPFSKENQQQVIDIIALEKGQNYTLYGKTGLTRFDSSGISWFVGFLDYKGIIYPFAFNADSHSLHNYTHGTNTKKPQIPFVKECLEEIINIKFDKI